MKMVKSLLLGSAAGLIAVAGAQAADLPVKAKPVKYVKICSLYGDGFYYIPGSDTCIRFLGYVRADYGFNVTGARTAHYKGAGAAQDRTVSRYSTRHRANLQIDTRTQTAYGTLRTYQSHSVTNENDGSIAVDLHRGFIQWAGFTFGHTQSYTDHPGDLGGGNGQSLFQTQAQSNTGANGTNQIAYTWQLGNGVNLHVGADERRVKSLANWSLNTTTVGTDPTTNRHGSSHPNPWISLKVDQAWGRAGIAVVANHNQARYYTQNPAAPCAQTGTTLCSYPSDEWGWAVMAGIDLKLPMIAPGDKAGAFFNYGVGASAYVGSTLGSPGLFGGGNQVALGVLTDAVYVNGSTLELTTGWSTGAFLQHWWTRNFSTTVYGNYAQIEYNSTVVNGRWFCGGAGGVNQNIVVGAATTCDPSFNYWTVGSHTDWYPVPNFRLAVDVMYTGIDTAFDGQTITLSKTQGARPTGAYTAKDQGIVSVVFRAQRNWR
jgi:hypothetical protein